ncbi:hypothetical protein M440DRAFT_1393300 [Trichoderma longibrachiatum ATCC 18648]|uniref:DUF7703 domain-containing protein n=1 Tax=Trichoderma longibrachiatum ATCC 18648 TaxID=983965 RepID=A0A2T4BXX3_TRILO|nr:hypothetical protein M440DRAFT_1393300 [Trichoderma longibrachiatum ATCC 18648]
MAAGSSSTVVSQGRTHDETTHIVMYVFFSLALYNVGELACHVAVTFKRLRGLYCWSFLEVVISALYIRETYRILRSYRGLVGVNRRTMWHVILINLVIIALDVSILVLQYTDHYDLQTAWKPFAYSLKLKMEFSVLNRLVELSQYMHRHRGIALIEAPTARGAPLPLLMVTADEAGTAAATPRRSGGGGGQDVSAMSTVASSIEPKAVYHHHHHQQQQQQQQQQPPAEASAAAEARVEAPPNVLQLEKSSLQCLPHSIAHAGNPSCWIPEACGTFGNDKSIPSRPASSSPPPPLLPPRPHGPELRRASRAAGAAIFGDSDDDGGGGGLVDVDDLPPSYEASTM